MKREDFVLLETEIGAGPLLIEASAGTGKTFTIAGLVLRLLLERAEPNDRPDSRHHLYRTGDGGTARPHPRSVCATRVDAFRSGKTEDDLIKAVLRKVSESSRLPIPV